MEILIFIIVVVIFYFITQTNAKIDFYELRSASKMMEAEVLEYRKEKVNIRNDYTKIYYPYARIITDGHFFGRILKVRYTNSWNKPFKIRERIKVFYNNGELYYWDAMDKGIDSILPKKWPWA